MNADEPLFETPQMERQRDPRWAWWLPIVLAVIVLLAAVAMTASAHAALFSWGGNPHLELDAGYRSGWEESPVPMRGLPPVKELAAGEGANAALDTEGCIETWGGNDYGQRGIGHISRPDAVISRPLCGVRQIAVGGADVIALLDDGTVDMFGGNLLGEAGNGTGTAGKEIAGMAIPTPQPVPGLSGIQHIYGGASIFAVRADGSVVAWGANAQGELGLGYRSAQVTRPVVVPGLNAPVQISTKPRFGFAGLTLVLTASGQVLAAGGGTLGELGPNVALLNRYTFAPVQGLPDNVVSVAAGPVDGYALTSTRQVYDWGADQNSQLGQPAAGKCALAPCEPTPRALPIEAEAIGAGVIGYAAAISNGRVLTWGEGVEGNLGHGSRKRSPTPTAVSGLSGVTSIAVGNRHMYAAGASSTATTWLTSAVAGSGVRLDWAAAPTAELWHVTWREDEPGGVRGGSKAIVPSSRSYTVTGLHAGRWEIYVNNKIWPHPRVAIVTVSASLRRR